ncbi:MAG: ABC transporter ATP-binding protein [Planctomycetota bacterium]
MTSLIELQGVSKEYTRGGEQLVVLDQLNLSIDEKSFVAMMGPSGSGKTTILNLVGGLDKPDKGVVSVDGLNLAQLGTGELAKWRALHVGFVFQSFNLMPVLTAYENVALPLLLTPLARKKRREHAEYALEVVGLKDRMDHRPGQLSGGQEQRVAIARAIVTDPALIVADEPTGDLDRENADEVLDLLTRLNQELGKTILMVTHDPAAAKVASRTLHLDKGALADRGAA